MASDTPTTPTAPTPPAPAPPIPRLALTSKEAAASLGIGVRLLWEKTACGEIPCTRIGRLVRYPVVLLEKYLADRAEGGAK